MSRFTFNPNDLHRLNRLAFVTRKLTLDEAGGTHRTRRSGEGSDFLDFRPYTPGDDFRKIDWVVYGRLRQLVIRLHEAPRQLSVQLLIDSSRSMRFGTPISKMLLAQRIACALAFIGLRNGDRVFVSSFAEGMQGSIGPIQGARALSSVVKFLQRMPTGTHSDLYAAVQKLRAQHRTRGMFIILSDFLNVARSTESIQLLTSGGARVVAVQVLDGLDRGEGLEGNLRLRDSESGKDVDVHVDERTLNEFQTEFEAHRQRFEDFVGSRGQNYAQTSTQGNYLELVCEILRSKAIVR